MTGATCGCGTASRAATSTPTRMGWGISVDGSRASLNTAWAVHVYHGPLQCRGQGHGMYLLLHSAAYGRYLAATDRPAPRGHCGFRVVQRNYDQQQLEAVMWQVTGVGAANALLLRNVGGCYLRANGKFCWWNNGVTVDQFENLSTMMHWIVEPIPPRDGMPAISGAPVRDRHPGDLSVVLRLRRPEARRVIRFVRANNPEAWLEFDYRSRSVYRLRIELANRLGLIDRFTSLIMCVRAGRYGKLTPLIENLPRDRDGVTIEIVVLMSGTPAANELRHPNVDIRRVEEDQSGNPDSSPL
ncbi:unnamed protein product [Alopecurus aequalis]